MDIQDILEIMKIKYPNTKEGYTKIITYLGGAGYIVRGEEEILHFSNTCDLWNKLNDKNEPCF